MEIKLPEGFDNKEDAMEALVQRDLEAAESELCIIREGMERFLLDNKGYPPDEVEKEVEFAFVVGSEKCRSKADFIIKISDRRLMLVKCYIGALVSRERQAVACARVMDSYQVPFAVVTDGNNAEILDTLTGKVIGEGLEKIPSKAELEAKLEGIKFKGLAPDRAEKEKRILLAFDVIKCSINYGE